MSIVDFVIPRSNGRLPAHGFQIRQPTSTAAPTKTSLKAILAFADFPKGEQAWYERLVGAGVEGFEVRPWAVSLERDSRALSWTELDRRWRRKDRKLLAAYRRLQQLCCECDVLLAYDGANLHPELLRYLPTFNVLGAFTESPQMTELAEQAAAWYDAVLYGNAASCFQYAHWGARRMYYSPPPIISGEPPAFIHKQTPHDARDVDLVLFCGGPPNAESKRRQTLREAFPGAPCLENVSHGPPQTHSARAAADVLRRAKISVCLHESVGPASADLLLSAAAGALVVSDNKTGLGHLFQLGQEAVGFDTVPEAVREIRYYLDHPDERATIAAAGCRRFSADYQPKNIWQRIHRQLDQWGVRPALGQRPLPPHLPGKLSADSIVSELRSLGRAAKRRARAVRRRWQDRSAGRTPSEVEPDERFYLGERVTAYHENPPMHGYNNAQKRVEVGKPLEWPNILAVNWAVTSLIGPATKIVEIGSGTGPFAHFAACDPRRTIHAFEEDDEARSWAIAHRSHPNVQYAGKYVPGRDAYDLLVSVEVIEHVSDLREFVTFCSGLAPRAIFTTPNRLYLRGADDIGPPKYKPHVREFSPGELYLVLKMFYRDVWIYHLPKIYVPWLEPMNLVTPGHTIVAECNGSLAKAA